VQLYDVPHDRKPEPKPAVPSRECAVPLPKPVEDVRQKILANALSRISHADERIRTAAFETDFNRSAVWRELDRVRKQVPNNLLDSACIAQNDSGLFLDLY